MKTLKKDYWMPFTANRDFKQNPRLIKRAQGVYLWTQDDRKIIDASSGLFCVGLGHCRPEILEAVTKQMQILDYSSPFQAGHNISFEFAEKLVAKLPEGIENVFFTNSGSESIDTAIKLATAYHRANKEPERTQLVSRERAYHGVNIGGTSLAGITKNREVFSGITLSVSFLRHTLTNEEPFCVGEPQKGVELADDLERIVSVVGGKNISAVFVEPVAGSTGFLIPPKGYLQKLRQICDKYGILLVFDEVITGFGRLGSFFAAETFDVIPDIMIMAKTLTNAAIPMGAVACKKEIYDCLIEQGKGAIEFFHGYTYSGHPAACAAGLATLEIFEKDNILANVRDISPYFIEKIMNLKSLSAIQGIRTMGLVAGIDFRSDGSPGQFGLAILKKFFQAGMHIKFTGDTALIAPPLISKKEHIDEICDIFFRVLS